MICLRCVTSPSTSLSGPSGCDSYPKSGKPEIDPRVSTPPSLIFTVSRMELAFLRRLGCHMWSAARDGQLINSENFNFLSYCVQGNLIARITQISYYFLSKNRPVRIHKQDLYFPYAFSHKSGVNSTEYD